MLRAKTFAWGILFGLVMLGQTQAGWHEMWDRFHLDWHRNNCWSEPFTTVDRRAARAPFAAMVNSGWRTQNTLGQHYFDRDTQALNEAGQRKLFWIIHSAPVEQRTIYVAQTMNSTQSEQRVDAVQQSLAQMMPDQSLPPVVPTALEPRGWPAEYIDTIDRKATSSIPPPRLPAFKEAGGGGL